MNEPVLSEVADTTAPADKPPSNTQLFDIAAFLALHRVKVVGMVQSGALLSRLLLKKVFRPPVEHTLQPLPKNSFGLDAVYYFANPLRATQLSTSPLQLQGSDFLNNFGFAVNKGGFLVNTDHLLKIKLTAKAGTVFTSKAVFVFNPHSQRVHRVAANTALNPGDLILAGIYVLQI
ncbi:hypothetical protein [Rheinheimera sp. F8]|uniref:hypothetical protein n=1 Tax=Rheinheimera sp. F8 TaxID=1763998 RepID=UPI000744D701|nr:hypothetical protein [Rheinheimera sp. F8]ALZ76703.1 hypothetical protein ATY27_13675 [Rheinheimera sp. F8]